MSSADLTWIVGAQGFLGKNLVRCFSQKTSVQSFSRREVDLENASTAEKFFREKLRTKVPKTLFYAAAYGVNPAQKDAELCNKVNVETPLKLAGIAQDYGVKNFVYFGSCFEYGSVSTAISERTPLNPQGPYAESKSRALQGLESLAKKSDLRLILTRLFGQWGWGEPDFRLVPQLIAASRTQTPIPTTGGEQIRDYLYSEDTAEILSRLIESNLPSGRIVNVASGQRVLLKDFIQNVLHELNASHLLRLGAVEYRVGERMSLWADVTELQKWIAIPELTSVSEGLKRMMHG